MLLPGEDPAEFATDDAVLERHIVYRFSSSLAKQMRTGRTLLIGDAAHIWPRSWGRGCARGCGMRPTSPGSSISSSAGGFQALKHRLADLAASVDDATAAARYAAALAADDPDVAVATALAQACCGDLAVTAAEEAVQLHAGLGMTWEHPAHLYLKRAKADQLAFGTAGEHRARLAGLIDLPGASR